PADGMTSSQQLTDDGEVLRYGGVPSPDGKWVAYTDLQQNAWLLNVETKAQRKISTNQEGVGDIAWSPDSKWLAFVQTAHNSFSQIFLHGLESQESIPITTDRMNDESPRWSPDGQFIYFLSDRNFQSLVGSPWGTRQPEAYFDHKYQLYHLPLQAGTTSPFQPRHELSPEEEDPDDDDKKKGDKSEVSVKVDFDGIQRRIHPVPIGPGNYRGLAVGKKAIYFLSRETGIGAKTHLMALKIDWDQPEAKSIAEGVRSFELASQGKHLLIRKGSDHYVVQAGTQPISDWSQAKLNLSGWKFALDPLEDWKQLFTDAWRMERDYFYDPGMHGVDWGAMHAKYLPLVDRVTTREELSDLIGRFVGELSALHTSVGGGDTRDAVTSIGTATLGALLRRTEQGYLVEKIYQADPDFPEELSPLQAPGVNISEGDRITHIDGREVGSVNHLNALLRNKGGAWVRVGYRTAEGQKQEAMVKPTRNEYSLRYHDWEYSRRQEVERMGAGKIGYVHLQAMGSNDLSRWYREFYPVHDRQGLIIDVRGNRGGNIESLVLEKLLRPTWFYWKGRSGEPYGNMPYAFNGHMVVLMDARTASDGEAFAEGFKRLDLGKLIGMRTWGGEIWLSSANRLSDNGIARATMFGVYSPEGEWIVENHGVEPDIEVDNLPHQTFEGKDAQLEAAVEHLEQLIEKDPRLTPPVPPYPDKSVP
ncbi:MAG: S41 family peptidase, partial [Bacteroidota bacterium]